MIEPLKPLPAHQHNLDVTSSPSPTDQSTFIQALTPAISEMMLYVKSMNISKFLLQANLSAAKVAESLL